MARTAIKPEATAPGGSVMPEIIATNVSRRCSLVLASVFQAILVEAQQKYNRIVFLQSLESQTRYQKPLLQINLGRNVPRER